MSNGTISSLREKGFGFITRDGQSGGSDLFFHRSAVRDDGFDRLRSGQRVTFTEEPDPRDRSRQHAANVQPVSDPEDA